MSVDNQKKTSSSHLPVATSTNQANSSSLSSVSSISPKNIAVNNLKVIQLNMQKQQNGNCATNGSVTSSGSSSTNSSTYVKNKSSGHHHQQQNNQAQSSNNKQQTVAIHDGTNLADFDVQSLPASIKFELDQLELELLEGDITQKGYDKKRARILDAYLNSISPMRNGNKDNGHNTNQTSSASNTHSATNSDGKEESASSTKTKEKIRVYRKKNKDESGGSNGNSSGANGNRYHSGLFFD
jgi:hypothetical protein